MAQPVMEILNRIKNLRQFDIEVDLPDGFHLNGVIPFDMTISQSKGKFKVYADSLTDAKTKVDSFIQRNISEEE